MAHAAKADNPTTTEQLEVDGRLYTITIEPDGAGYLVGLCKEIPGCGSEGRTLDELRSELTSAIHECLLTMEPGQDAAETAS
jgi:predicted RNase H-like HicB family nuclease